MRKETHKEITAVLGVLLVLAGIPALLWYWRTAVMPGKYPPGTKIIHLTPASDGAIWTEGELVGYDYWWKKATPVQQIPLTQGDHVVLLLHSTDVHHSFSIPSLHLGPVFIPAGHTVEVRFDADRAGELRFLCTQVCGREHNRLESRFWVTPRGTSGAKGL